MHRTVASAVVLLISLSSVQTHADESADTLRPAFQKSCVRCHGKNGRASGKVNLLELKSDADLIANPELIRDLIDVLDSDYMPPEGEPPLAGSERKQMLTQLHKLAKASVQSRTVTHSPIRRMNRFQYNNAVQDLFQLKVEVFPLPERMMREHGDYFQPQTGKMPDRVRVGSRPLGKSQLIEPHLSGVTPFPQDLRAEHGFDTRADHLTLSPLLLESFLKLSRSIVESPEFNAKTCGIWKTFFAPPSGDAVKVVRERLREFLTLAFRRPVEGTILDRYAGHVSAQLRVGVPFTDAMKVVAAAALASPRFFYIYDAIESDEPNDFNLASRLSFFLWGSIPDRTLLNLAAEGTLHEPDVLSEQVERMLRDKRLKRFCDSFPAQWLQLERIISSAPDPERFGKFYFAGGKYRASMHMMLEPLLLFETVLIEDQSILQFIDSDFSYRSPLLQAWYRDGSQGNPGSPVIVEFRRVPVTNRRQGGVITNAAVMTMTSNATRSQPITRGAWVAGVILNDPPEPPPADVPPLSEKLSVGQENLTLRERFAAHRTRTDCAACHKRLDPLGFVLENYDAVGTWRDNYENGREVDSSGTLFGKHDFDGIVEFKDVLLKEKDRFTRAFASHLLAYALGREVRAEDAPALDEIVRNTADAEYRFQSLIKEIVLSEPFRATTPTHGDKS